MARRIVLIVLGVLAVLLIVAIGAGAFVALSPLPKTDGVITAAGLQAPVTIYRDEWGVPQIYADNSHDLFFSQGYVHAQDRLFQLDFQRRVGLGRLSEVLGEATLDTDRFLRTVGTNRAAQQNLEHMSADSLATLQAYSDGVNAGIAEMGGNLPLEFRILGYTPEPWQPLLLSRRKHRGTAPIRLQLQRHSSARRRRILPALDTRHADAHHQRDVHHRHYLPEELDGHATTDDRVRRGRCCVHAPHYGAITQLDSDASQRGVAKETGLRASYYLIATYYVAARPL